MKARIPGSRALLKPDKKAVRDYVDQHQKAVTRRLPAKKQLLFSVRTKN